MEILRRFLTFRPDFVRLMNSTFAVLVGFGVVDITPEQFALVVTGVEALFQYVSKLAFERDVAALASADPQGEVA